MQSAEKMILVSNKGPKNKAENEKPTIQRYNRFTIVIKLATVYTHIFFSKISGLKPIWFEFDMVQIISSSFYMYGLKFKVL